MVSAGATSTAGLGDGQPREGVIPGHQRPVAARGQREGGFPLGIGRLLGDEDARGLGREELDAQPARRPDDRPRARNVYP